MNLTKEQECVVDAVRRGHNVLVTGPGGTGKTELIKHLNTLKNELLKPDKTLGVTAMTGAAAVLIQGQTLHSYLGVGLAHGNVDCVVKRVINTGYAPVLRKLQILIIDEVSMLSAELFDKLEAVMRKIRRDERLFGGVQLVLSGDFLQLPCIDGKFCFESNTWNTCIPKNYQFHLNIVFRQDNNMFQDILNKARFGNIEMLDIDYIKSNTRPKISGHHRKEPFSQSKETEKTMQAEADNSQRFYQNLSVKPTVIYCRNVDVNQINTTKLAKLPVQQVYKYVTKIRWLQKKHISQFKPTELFLSKGAQVMLNVNINVKDCLVNGSRGVVVGFEKNTTGKVVPKVRFVHNKHPENVYLIDYHTYEMTNSKYDKPVAKVTCIPLKLAYAVTVHKSQGMTLDCAYIDFKGVFEYGQAYVALSRIKSLENSRIENLTKEAFRAHPKALAFYENKTF